MARNTIADIHARGKIPFLVGGTGQYIRAVIEGWEIPQVEPDVRLRDALENWADAITAQGLHQRLAVIDPSASKRIEPNNIRRTIRALEVIFLSGQRFSTQRQKGTSPYNSILIGMSISRTELHARIDSRIDEMLAAGFVAEVESLLSSGYPPDLPTFSAIGYQEIIDYLHGKTTLEEAVMIIKRRTRQFVRRQANWFKEDDPNIYWIDYQTPYPEITSFLREKLDSN